MSETPKKKQATRKPKPAAPDAEASETRTDAALKNAVLDAALPHAAFDGFTDRVLEEAGYGRNGEFVGLDVKAMRTQAGSPVTAHLKSSRELFLHLVDKVRSLDRAYEQSCIEARDYEALELYLLKHLLGVR